MAAHDPTPSSGAPAHYDASAAKQAREAFDGVVAAPSATSPVLWSFARSVSAVFLATAIFGGVVRAVIAAIAAVTTLDSIPSLRDLLSSVLSTGPSADDFLTYLSVFATVAIAAGLSVLLAVDSGSRESSHTRRWAFGRNALLFTGVAVWTVLPFQFSTYDDITRIVIGIGFVLLLVCASELTDTPLLRIAQADARRAAERAHLIEFVHARMKSGVRWACTAEWRQSRRRDIAVPVLFIAGAGAVGVVLAGILGGAVHRWSDITFTIAPALTSWALCSIIVISTEHRRLGRLLDDLMDRIVRTTVIPTALLVSLALALTAMSVGSRLVIPTLTALFLPLIITAVLLRTGGAVDASTRARVLERLAMLRPRAGMPTEAVKTAYDARRAELDSASDGPSMPGRESAAEHPWASLQVGPLEVTLHNPLRSTRTQRRTPGER